MSKVATRFAFLTTGALHIGDTRTALFNWLYLKNQNGIFYLRIEDFINKGKKNLELYQLLKRI